MIWYINLKWESEFTFYFQPDCVIQSIQRISTLDHYDYIHDLSYWYSYHFILFQQAV